MNALLLLHQGFEEVEAVTPADILRRGGIEVTLASLDENRLVKGRNNITLQADTDFAAVEDQIYDAIIIPGGPGTYSQLRPDQRLGAWLKKHQQNTKIIAAICAAPLLLNDYGLLDGAYTAHPATKDELQNIDSTQAVIVHGNRITSRGAGTAIAFALAILEHLTNSELAHKVADEICYEQVTSAL